MMPTMVSFPERQLLRDWVALNWLGFGDIVEIGAFAGGSTTAILQGMEATRHPGTLHVYDVFRFPKGGHEDVYRGLIGIQGESFRKVFDGITRQWSHRLKVTEGDASQEKWTGGPIEMLHIDCSVSREFHEKVALEFYPKLMPQATVIHQDWGYEKAPFIKEMMAKLAPKFIGVASMETTRYFVLDGKITREEIAAALKPAEAMAA